MAPGKDLAADAAELCELFTETNLSTLDFDELTLWLTQAANTLAQQDSALEELALLREDYQCRIAGMLKAIAVADRTTKQLESLVDLAESLKTMTADDLIRTYRKTSACFRDHFPASFPRMISPPSSSSLKVDRTAGKDPWTI